MKDRTGVVITQVIQDSSADTYLRKDDILLEIDGIKVADDATIIMKENGRVSASYLIRMHHIGDKFEATILRKGKELKIKIPLKTEVTLIPYQHERQPKYFIFGGLVFMPLTKNYLYAWGRSWVQKAPIHFVNIIKNSNYPTKEKKELVFLQSILADKENAGYEMSHVLVQEVNGVKINSFKDLVDTIENTKEKDVKITLQGGSIIILNTEKAFKANKRLLQRYRIKESSFLR